MAGGSGTHTVRANRASSSSPPRFQAFILILSVLTATSGCVYFNALYNANRLYSQGVKEIDADRESNGRVLLLESIEKAERIVQTKPDSRWADDAVRLMVRARILRDDWPEAAQAGQLLMRYATTERDSAEAARYWGEAELNLGNMKAADSLLTFALEGEEGEEARAELLAYRGRARFGLGNLDAAEADLERVTQLRPEWVPPRIDLVRLLVHDGRGSEAAAELAYVFTLPLRDREERSSVVAAEYMAEQDSAATIEALAEVTASTLQPGNQARLLKMRADLELALGDSEGARRDYELTTLLYPDAGPAAAAALVLVRLDLRDVSTIAGFDSLAMRAGRLAAQPSGQRISEVRQLDDTFFRMQFWLSNGGLGFLLAAETARDELDAPHLARTLLVAYADSEPDALWVPKAILAALDLSPLDSGGRVAGAAEPSDEELRRRLLEDYQDSAYVRALFGEEGGQFTYEELELGLQRQLQRLEVVADQELRNRPPRMQQSGG